MRCKGYHVGSAALVLFLLFLGGPVASVTSSAFAAVLDEITYLIEGDVYYGDQESFNTPAVLSRSKVFDEIPEVKTIRREKLKKDSPRYVSLLEKANKVFREVVEEVADEKGYDLVVEKGGIKASDGSRIPNITKKVIKAVPDSSTSVL